MSSETHDHLLPGPEDTVVRLENVGKRYTFFERPVDRLWQALFKRPSHTREISVLRGVTLSVKRGETVGIIGRNGAGKSTLLQIIAGTLRASEGSVETRGRIAPLIELGSGFNPELTGEENVVFNALLLGMSDEEVRGKYDQIVAFADIGDYINRPVKTYSSGMHARLAFSVAAHLDPEILIIDEILSVGDTAFQRKCMNRFYEIRERGCTILLVAHDEYMIRSVCQKALYLRQGDMVAFGDPVDVVGQYVEDTMSRAEPSQATIEAQTLVGAPAFPAAVGPDADTVARSDELVEARADPQDEAGDLNESSIEEAQAEHIAGPDSAPATLEASEIEAAEMKESCAPTPADVLTEVQPANQPSLQDTPDRIYRITNVALLDEEGHATDVVRHGSIMHLEFTFEAISSEVPDRISFVFNLYAQTGEYICGSTTLMEGMPAHRGVRVGRVRVTFPKIALLTGKYHWRVAINDGGGLYVLQYALHVCPFRVAVDRYVSAGLVHLERTWEFELHG